MSVNIRLEHTGKRYRRYWVFRGVSDAFTQSDVVAVLGANGSGKSTMLRVLSGLLTPSEGRVIWENQSRTVMPGEVYSQVAWCAPALSLYENFTLQEAIRFHLQFRSLRSGISVSKLPEIMELELHETKVLSEFSSGMKQRVKLALAILSDAPLLLLDEPTSHLDEHGVSWFHDLLGEHLAGRLTFIASNRVESETAWCNRILEITDFK